MRVLIEWRDDTEGADGAGVDHRMEQLAAELFERFPDAMVVSYVEDDPAESDWLAPNWRP